MRTDHRPKARIVGHQIDPCRRWLLLLRKMVPSYYESLQGYFDYLLPLLETNQDPTKSYFLNHNGTTNMIAPLWHLVETGKANYVARILRALYTYEVFLFHLSTLMMFTGSFQRKRSYWI